MLILLDLMRTTDQITIYGAITSLTVVSTSSPSVYISFFDPGPCLI